MPGRMLRLFRDGACIGGHLHAWPVAVRAGGVHALHSSFEGEVYALLAEEDMRIIKPPSANFLSVWEGDWADVIRLLVEENVWPDFICFLPSGRLCIVEAAGLCDPLYRLRILEKTALFKRMECTHGIEWAVIRSAGENIYVEYRSVRLSCLKSLEDVVNQGVGNQT